MENFSTTIKKEILNLNYKYQTFNDFVFGLFFSARAREKDEFEVQIINQDLRELLITLLTRFKYEFQINKTKINITFNSLEYNFNLIQNMSNFMGAIFFNVGSISDIKKNYHLELKFYFEEELAIIKKLLGNKKYNFSFTSIKRQKYWVLYSKSKISINDFLASIKMRASYFKLIDEIIFRDNKNYRNKFINLEINNIKKITLAAEKHIANSVFMCKNNLQTHFTKDELTFFEIRQKNKTLSLSEITIILHEQKNIKKTKGGLNHWLRKLKNVVENEKNNRNIH